MREIPYQIHGGRVIRVISDERDPDVSGFLYSTAERCRNDSRSHTSRHGDNGDDHDLHDRVDDRDHDLVDGLVPIGPIVLDLVDELRRDYAVARKNRRAAHLSAVKP